MSKYEKSNELLKKAIEIIPVAAQTYSKSFRYFIKGESPLFIERGDGAMVWDIDGNQFLDFVCALGPITIGYNNVEINQAIIQQLEKGIVFSQPSPIEYQLARKLTQIIPGVEMVRFMKNGSDVTTAAIRLARAYTGRDMIAVCGYHGMHDWYIGATPNSLGVPKVVSDLTQEFIYNDIKSLENLLKVQEKSFAAIILEPIQFDGPSGDFLKMVRDLAREHGAILIFDEVVSGFRYALGGAIELYGVIPDLVAMGKGVANGMPLSILAGKKDILELIETKKVFISTTFGGECLSIAAALKTIEILEKPESYKHIWNLGRKLLDGLQKLIDLYDLNQVIKVYGLAPHGGVQFSDFGEISYLESQSIYQKCLIENGILTIGINNISLSHTSEDIDCFLKGAEVAMEEIKKYHQGKISRLKDENMINPIFKRNSRGDRK
ncbi:MAG: aspartate aminotransferase family protein [Firmicutes bacterium HGW-Firmicutes-7]|nr:MAG: aspartate aminotransferase family protein [Firmicutes bacterium HGW-Firmicutes-7]